MNAILIARVSTEKQKEITKMIDNLYFDKLQGESYKSAYYSFYQKLWDQETDVANRMSKLEEEGRNLHKDN